MEAASRKRWPLSDDLVQAPHGAGVSCILGLHSTLLLTMVHLSSHLTCSVM